VIRRKSEDGGLCIGGVDTSPGADGWQEERVLKENLLASPGTPSPCQPSARELLALKVYRSPRADGRHSEGVPGLTPYICSLRPPVPLPTVGTVQICICHKRGGGCEGVNSQLSNGLC
jgi:hypothetical protein